MREANVLVSNGIGNVGNALISWVCAQTDCIVHESMLVVSIIHLCTL